MNKDFDHGGNRWVLGEKAKEEYLKKIASVLQENTYQKKLFYTKKGDVLIWHANLLHGGEKVKDSNRSRKNMVMNCFGTGVIRYHEVTQWPCLNFKRY